MHTGILLRNFSPKKNKLALIDDQLGRIDCAYFSGAYHTGALLNYRLTGMPGRYLIEQGSMIDVPLSLARTDILFLHHVLEVCFYFIPIGSCIQGIFNLLQLLYDANSVHWDLAAKQFFLFRLFMQLGMQPSNYRLPAPLLDQLRMACSNGQPQLSQSDRAIVRTWLQHCLMQHPDIAQFNTTHFLNNQ